MKNLTLLQTNILDYLTRLVSFPSITPSSAGAIEYIHSLLMENGFSSKIYSFSNEKYEVLNLYARFGNSSPNICFAGHVDVVPSGHESLWRYSPFNLTLDNQNNIYGRGVVDMKGAIACMIQAALTCKNQVKGSISFLLTSDEEGEAILGLKKLLPLLKQQEEKIDLVILGEPTSNKSIGDNIKIGRRGSVNFILNIYGQQGHVAYPDLAENSLRILPKIAIDLQNLFKNQTGTNLEITSIDTGNYVSNIIPAQVEMRFNIRFSDEYNFASLEEIVRKTIEMQTSKYDLKIIKSAEAFKQNITKQFEDISSIIHNITNIKPEYSISGGTSDARFIKDYYSVLEIGLKSENAHKINENTSISDLFMLYKIYCAVLSNFLS